MRDFHEEFAPDSCERIEHAEGLKGHVVNRGYDGETVQEQIDKATNTRRQELLTPQRRDIKQVTPLVVTFHLDLPDLTCILCNYQCIIHTSLRLKDAVPRPPFSVSLPPNLKDLLVREAYGQTNHGCEKFHSMTARE